MKMEEESKGIKEETQAMKEDMEEAMKEKVRHIEDAVKNEGKAKVEEKQKNAVKETLEEEQKKSLEEGSSGQGGSSSVQKSKLCACKSGKLFSECHAILLKNRNSKSTAIMIPSANITGKVALEVKSVGTSGGTELVGGREVRQGRFVEESKPKLTEEIEKKVGEKVGVETKKTSEGKAVHTKDVVGEVREKHTRIEVRMKERQAPPCMDSWEASTMKQDDLNSDDFTRLVQQTAELKVYRKEEKKKRKREASEERGRQEQRDRKESLDNEKETDKDRKGKDKERERQRQKELERQGAREKERAREERMQEESVKEAVNATTGGYKVYRNEVLKRRVKIFWQFEKKWFAGEIDKYDPANGQHHVQYDDGDDLWYELHEEAKAKTLRWLDGSNKAGKAEKKDKEKETKRGGELEKETSECAVTGGEEKVRKNVNAASDSEEDGGSPRARRHETESDSRNATSTGEAEEKFRKKTKHRRRIRENSNSDSDLENQCSSRNASTEGKSRIPKKKSRKGETETGCDVICLDSDDDEYCDQLPADSCMAVESTDNSYFGPEERIKLASRPLAHTISVCARMKDIQNSVNALILPELKSIGPEERDPVTDAFHRSRAERMDCEFKGPQDVSKREATQAAFLMPYRGVGFYNSHGRFFTQKAAMEKVCCYLDDKGLVDACDHFLDFSAGSNEFAPMLSQKTRCTFQGFDIFPAKVVTNFTQKSWFDVDISDIPANYRDKEIVLGLNPPFGRDNIESRKFVAKGINTFRPRLLVLIVPPLGELRELNDYEEIHKDDRTCTGKDFYIPGAHGMGSQHSTDTNPNFIIYRRISRRVKRHDTPPHTPPSPPPLESRGPPLVAVLDTGGARRGGPVDPRHRPAGTNSPESPLYNCDMQSLQ